MPNPQDPDENEKDRSMPGNESPVITNKESLAKDPIQNDSQNNKRFNDLPIVLILCLVAALLYILIKRKK